MTKQLIAQVQENRRVKRPRNTKLNRFWSSSEERKVRSIVKMLGIATAQNPMAELEANMEKIGQLKLKQKRHSPRSSPELDDSGLTLEV